MESCRKEDFSEASAVGEFRNFLNIGVAKVYTLEQSATVARMRSNGCEKLCEGECGDSRVGWDTYSFGVFFHEYGRRVGMVPRSSLKGGKVSRMVEKITRTTNKKTTEHKTKKAHRPRLHHHVVFPLC